MPDNFTLPGSRVREIRQKLGLSQAELSAALIGSTSAHRRIWISAVERGTAHLSHEQAHLLLAMEKGYDPAKETTNG